MTWLSDEAVAHLRAIADEPDFGATRYRIVRELARGGMGVVYEADDLELQRRVAIKVLATEIASPPSEERMRAEARVIANLEHPGIVPLHDTGTLPDGRVFYAMKLVRGRTLSNSGAPATEVLRLFLRICEAVAFAHARAVIHCDLKPANVMVGEFGEVLVMDWGVARSMNAGPDAEVRSVMGTPGFMSPEQEQGLPLDATTDVFALGAMLRSIVAAPFPRRLAAIIEKATAAEPERRYPNARELAADIARYVDGQPVNAYRENSLERLGRWLERNRALVAVVVAYLVMRAIVLLVAHR